MKISSIFRPKFAKPYKRKAIPRKTFGRSKSLKNIFLGLLILISLSFVFTLLVSFFLSDFFKISLISVYGISNSENLQIEKELNTAYGLNIFTYSISQTKHNLINSNQFLENVNIRKYLPNKIIVEITEKQPNTTLINLNGAYLIDSEGIVLETISLEENTEINESEIELLKGFGDPNGEFVKEYFEKVYQAEQESTENISTEDKPFDFNEISFLERNKTLEVLKIEATNKASNIHNSISSNVSSTKYASLPRIFVYENKNYQESDKISAELLKRTTEIRNYFFSSQDLIVDKILWEGQYIITVLMTTDQKIRFGLQRSITEQLEDYIIVSEKLRLDGKTFKTMDLSTSKVSVL